MSNKAYDWRKGRKWISDESSNEKVGYFRPYICYHGENLEPTREEVNWWKKTFDEVKEKSGLSNVNGHSQPFLVHPTLGQILALTSLKKVELLERYRYSGVNDFSFEAPMKYVPVPLEEEPDSVKRWELRNGVIRNVSERVIKRDVPTEKELRQNHIEFIHEGKIDSEDYENIVWHSMIQNNEDYMALPYVGRIPLGEAKQSIDAYLEEKFQWVRENE